MQIYSVQTILQFITLWLLYIETPALDKCSQDDLLILQHYPNMEVFSDYHSERPPIHSLTPSFSPAVPFSHSSIVNHNATPWSSLSLSGTTTSWMTVPPYPDALLHALLMCLLKKLSWTNYD